MSKLVLFVCMGNIHRSVIAERLARKLADQAGVKDIHFESRGLQWYTIGPPAHSNLLQYPQAWNGSRCALEKRGIDLSNHVARPLLREDVEKAEIVIVMDKHLLTSQTLGVFHLFPEFKTKFRLFSELIGQSEDIIDCGEQSNDEMYEKTIIKIEMILSQGLNQLCQWINVKT